ncbi:MAG: hypothetical protein H6739_13605 [Alphaproteobacteria bacterium]|nr:hypothetical protein [Alphaproteobacteria bacterium]
MTMNAPTLAIWRRMKCVTDTWAEHGDAQALFYVKADFFMTLGDPHELEQHATFAEESLEDWLASQVRHGAMGQMPPQRLPEVMGRPTGDASGPDAARLNLWQRAREVTGRWTKQGDAKRADDAIASFFDNYGDMDALKRVVERLEADPR